MMVLGCDLGGTHTRLRIARCAPGTPAEPLAEQQYRSAEFPGLESVLAQFLARSGIHAADIAYACVAVAGPVRMLGDGQQCQLTNLPWLVDSAALSAAMSLPQVALINDFEAVAYGLETLTAADLLTLQEGEPVAGAPRALIGAGTGLGQSLLVWGAAGYHVIATEGGHVDFAPTDDLQLRLLQHWRPRLGRVSYEDVLSGPGLERIYTFLRSEAGDTAGAPALAPEPDLAAAIGRAAILGEDPLAARAVSVFLSIYGAQAGNLALTSMARGGVYIAGGIAPKLEVLMDAGEFMRSFLDKGRMAHLMPRFPVQVVRSSDVGLAGATQHACRLAGTPALVP